MCNNCKCKCTFYQQMSINTHCHQFSPSFHVPAPISDDALTLTMYPTPAFSPVRKVEFAGGETERRVELIHDSVSLVLYSTSYSVMGNSLWRVVQDTVRVKFQSSIDQVTNTPVTLEGPVRETLRIRHSSTFITYGRKGYICYTLHQRI